MSIIEPKIDVLLDRTDNDRFLLCALASKRAHDINDMPRTVNPSFWTNGRCVLKATTSHPSY